MTPETPPLPDRQALEHLRGKRVAVTGGTGFLGRHLLPQLAAAGADITCLVRRSSRRDGLPPGVRTAEVDLCRGDGLGEALRGQDILIHMAALLFGLGWQDYLRANSAAARQIADALTALRAEGQPLPRVVLVSSLAASGPCAVPPGRGDDSPGAPVSAYGWSKLLVEQMLGRAVGDRLVILRPPIIYGSGDRGLLPVFQGLRRGLAALPGWKRQFPMSVIHARDAAQALLLLCREEARGVYHVNDGGVHSMRTFYEGMARALGRPAHLIPVPVPVLGLTACAAGLWGMACRLVRPGGRAPNWNLDKFREARHEGWLCDSTRIHEELGYVPTVSLAEGLAEAVAGYRAEGLL